MTTLVSVAGWIVVVAFAATFIVSIAALIGWIKVDEKYRSRLFTSCVLKFVAAGCFLFYSGFSHAEPRYCGDWKGTIYWYDDYSQTLFNYQGKTPDFQPLNRVQKATYTFTNRALESTKDSVLGRSKTVRRLTRSLPLCRAVSSLILRTSSH
jgi:hypothetical protein